MTDSEMRIPPAPSNIPHERWMALCLYVRRTINLEQLKAQGDSPAAALMVLQRVLEEELPLFSAMEIALALQLLHANYRADQLEKLVRIGREQAIFGTPPGGDFLPVLGWLEGMSPSYLYRSRPDYPNVVLGDVAPTSLMLPRTYYIFIEDATRPNMTGSVDGPEGTAVDPRRHRVLREAPMRFRSSGLLLGDFDRIEGRFETLDPENISLGQRARRKRDLREHLAGIGLPILDLYMAPDHPDLRAVRTMLVAGSWHVIGVSAEPVLSPDCPVLIGAPEDEPDSLNHLTYLAAVPPHIEVRLRDIFSLAHIPDARFDIERGEGGRGPPPDRPPEGLEESAETKWDSDQTAVGRYRPPALEA